MERTRHIPLVIAGDGPERPALQSLAQELKLTNVEFVGHKNGNDLDKLISASRFTVLPSRAYETLGKTINREAEIILSRSLPCLERKSIRLNSSHANTSYAVFCLK